MLLPSSCRSLHVLLSSSHHNLHVLLPPSRHGLHVRPHRRQVPLNLSRHALLNKAHLQTRQGKGPFGLGDLHRRSCMGCTFY